MATEEPVKEEKKEYNKSRFEKFNEKRKHYLEKASKYAKKVEKFRKGGYAPVQEAKFRVVKSKSKKSKGSSSSGFYKKPESDRFGSVIGSIGGSTSSLKNVKNVDKPFHEHKDYGFWGEPLIPTYKKKHNNNNSLFDL